MDLPNLDPPPPPTTVEPMAFAAASAAHTAHVANPTPTQPSVHNHPPYAEMITEAIATLKERNGSSKKAIAKYLETHYSNLPPTHSALLTHHLKRLKTNGQVLMVKHSYKLSRSAVGAPVAANGAVSDPAASVGPKRRPGRPPKPKSVQDAVPVFAQPPNPMNAVPIVVPGPAQPQNAVVENLGLGSVYVAVGPVTGRGRPAKSVGAKRGPGRPPKSSVVHTGVGRGRGRPKKNAASPAARVKRLGRPRGRPPKVNSMEKGGAAVDGGTTGPLPVAAVTDGALTSGGIVPAAGKRKGRPPKAGSEAKKPRKAATGEPKKPRKLSGKPLGRPKKNAFGMASQTPDNQLLMAYLDLKGKLESFQSRIKQTVSIIKPYVNVETAVTALQELETLATMDVSSSSNTQSQQPQLQLQPQS